MPPVQITIIRVWTAKEHKALMSFCKNSGEMETHKPNTYSSIKNMGRWSLRSSALHILKLSS